MIIEKLDILSETSKKNKQSEYRYRHTVIKQQKMFVISANTPDVIYVWNLHNYVDADEM